MQGKADVSRHISGCIHGYIDVRISVLGEDRTCSSGDTIADRQARGHTQTRSSHYFAALSGRRNKVENNVPTLPAEPPGPLSPVGPVEPRDPSPYHTQIIPHHSVVVLLQPILAIYISVHRESKNKTLNSCP